MAMPMILKNRSRVGALLVAVALLGCIDSAENASTTDGALEALGEYVVTSNTCGEHTCFTGTPSARAGGSAA